MTQTRPVQVAFSAGENDPLLSQRSDFVRFQTGAAQCRGFIPLRQGGATRAPGTIFRGTTRNNQVARRIPFQFSATDSLTLEFTHLKMRVWRYGNLVMDGAAPYEIDTPYGEDDLPNLDFQQNNDLVYLVDGRQPMRVLKRFALDNWEIEEAILDFGPFETQNIDKDLTVQVSPVVGFVQPWEADVAVSIGDLRKVGANVYEVTANTHTTTGSVAPTHTSGTQDYDWDNGGTTETISWEWKYSTDFEGEATISASQPIFSVEDEGRLFLIKPADFKGVPNWLANQPGGVGDYARNDDKIYELTKSPQGNGGRVAPVHEQGTVQTDRGTRAEWTFRSTLEGIVRISEVVDANTATVQVIKTIPKPAIDSPTYRWSKGAWSSETGYPRAITIYGQRLYAANSLARPRMVWASVIGDHLNFSLGDNADDGFAYEVDGGQSRNEIYWLKGGQRGIYIGALGSVLRGFSSAAGEAIGPRTFDTELVDSEGAVDVPPVMPFGFPVYISHDGARLQETRYSFETDGSKPLELSLASQHLGASSFRQIALETGPQRRFWLNRENGIPVVTLYDPEQDVLGSVPVPMAGGHVENIDITTDAAGKNRVVTMVVRRVIGGETVRCVEEVANNNPAMLGAGAITDFNHAFCGSVFEFEEGQTTVSVPHLAGEDVWTWTDSGHFGPLTVAGNGDVTIPLPVTKAIVGLADDTHVLESNDVVAAGRNGDTRGRKRRLEGAMGLAVFKSSDGEIASVERKFGQDDREVARQSLVDYHVEANRAQAFSGVRRIDVPTGHADAVRVRVYPRGIAPLTVTAIIPNIDEAGA